MGSRDVMAIQEAEVEALGFGRYPVPIEFDPYPFLGLSPEPGSRFGVGRDDFQLVAQTGRVARTEQEAPAFVDELPILRDIARQDRNAESHRFQKGYRQAFHVGGKDEPEGVVVQLVKDLPGLESGPGNRLDSEDRGCNPRSSSTPRR